MPTYSFQGTRTTKTHTDWMFSGPDPEKTYGVSVNRSTGNYFGFWQPVGAPDDTEEMPINAPETRELLALVHRVANPVSRTLDEIRAIVTAGQAEMPAALKDAIDRLDKVSGLAGSLYSASKEMLDAFGGDTPKWLREEAVKVEDALVELKEAAIPLKKHGPVAETAPAITP